jgi:hypothetical protein
LENKITGDNMSKKKKMNKKHYIWIVPGILILIILVAIAGIQLTVHEVKSQYAVGDIAEFYGIAETGTTTGYSCTAHYSYNGQPFTSESLTLDDTCQGQPCNINDKFTHEITSSGTDHEICIIYDCIGTNDWHDTDCVFFDVVDVQCIETDDGEDISEKGTITYGDITRTDSCEASSSNKVNEYACGSDGYYLTVITCNPGDICKDGACTAVCDPSDTSKYYCDGNIWHDDCNDITVDCTETDEVCGYSDEVEFYACISTECTSDSDCDDNNECTENECSGGGCQYIGNPMDGTDCGIDKVCSGGSCIEDPSICTTGKTQNERCDENTLKYEECIDKEWKTKDQICDITDNGFCNTETLECDIEFEEECVTDDDCKKEAKVKCDDGTDWFHTYKCETNNCAIGTDTPPDTCISDRECDSTLDCETGLVCDENYECNEPTDWFGENRGYILGGSILFIVIVTASLIAIFRK